MMNLNRYVSQISSLSHQFHPIQREFSSLIGAYLIDGFTAALSRYLTLSAKQPREPSLADLVDALDPQVVLSTPVVFNSLTRPLHEVSAIFPHYSGLTSTGACV